MIDNEQLEYVKTGLFACATHLRSASNSGVKSVREQAQTNALYAYASVAAHFPGLRSSDRSLLEEWAHYLGLELRESFSKL